MTIFLLDQRYMKLTEYARYHKKNSIFFSNKKNLAPATYFCFFIQSINYNILTYFYICLLTKRQLAYTRKLVYASSFFTMYNIFLRKLNNLISILISFMLYIHISPYFAFHIYLYNLISLSDVNAIFCRSCTQYKSLCFY